LFVAAEQGRCTLVVPSVCFAETVWVLLSFYQVDRVVLANQLGGLLERTGIQCEDSSVCANALQRLASTSCDFIDCYLAAHAVASGHVVASFDNDFRKFSDVVVWDANDVP